jgi:hypothetical protein
VHAAGNGPASPESADDGVLTVPAIALRGPQEALRSLSPAEKVALVRIAKHYTRGTRYEYQELMNECILRHLDGRRPRPASVAVVPFLGGVMRSIAFEWRRAESVVAECEVIDIPVEYDIDAGLELERIVRSFGDNTCEQTLFLGFVYDLSKEQLQKLTNLTSKQFDSMKRKVQRHLKKLNGR